MTFKRGIEGTVQLVELVFPRGAKFSETQAVRVGADNVDSLSLEPTFN